MYEKTTRAECDELLRQANRERAIKAAATRRVRQWLEDLHSLEDVRDQVGARWCLDDSVGFLDQLYGLEDPRG
jgi:hypothetical protein